MGKMRVVILGITIAVVIGGLFKFFSTAKGYNIAGDFERITFVRNENNRGSILKIYAVAVGDTVYADYFQYGNSIPHNAKNGETIIYFFNKREGAPRSLSLALPHFDKEQFTPIAIFTKKRHFTGIVTKL